MADKKPLVLGDGSVNQIQDADTLLVPGNSKFKGNKIQGRWHQESSNTNPTRLQAEQTGTPYAYMTSIPLIPPEDGGYITQMRLFTDENAPDSLTDEGTVFSFGHANGDFVWFNVDTNNASLEPIGYQWNADGDILMELYHPDVLGGAYIYSGLYVQDFTNLGDGAPPIKMKKITGTTPPAASSGVSLAHGLTVSKILSVDIFIQDTNNNYIPPEYGTQDIRYASSFYVNASSLVLVLGATATSLVFSRPFKALITYEQ